MPSNRDIERKYIEQQLDLHGEYLTNLFIDAIIRGDVRKTEYLLSYFESGSKWTVEQRLGLPVLLFSFPNYGRFVEIKEYQKKGVKGKMKGFMTHKVDSMALLYGITSQPKKLKAKERKIKLRKQSKSGLVMPVNSNEGWGNSTTPREKFIVTRTKDKTLKKEWNDNKASSKKNAKWYARNVYGAQNKLIGKLMWGLSDIEREKIKNQLLQEQVSSITVKV